MTETIQWISNNLSIIVQIITLVISLFGVHAYVQIQKTKKKELKKHK